MTANSTSEPSPMMRAGERPMSSLACESCGRGADVTLAFPDTTFQLCLRCVPLERRHQVVALPGHEQLVELLRRGAPGTHQQTPPARQPTADTGGTR